MTNYFLPYSKQQRNSYLKATLIVSSHGLVRQQESIIVDESHINYNINYYHKNRNTQLSIVSSSTQIHMKYFHLFILLFISIDLIRR